MIHTNKRIKLFLLLRLLMLTIILWLFISNVLQLILLPLIMVGQNLQSRHAEARADADFEVNIQAEKEIKLLEQELQQTKEQIDTGRLPVGSELPLRREILRLKREAIKKQ